MTGDAAGRKGNDRGLDRVQRKPEVKRGVNRPKGALGDRSGTVGNASESWGVKGSRWGH